MPISHWGSYEGLLYGAMPCHEAVRKPPGFRVEPNLESPSTKFQWSRDLTGAAALLSSTARAQLLRSALRDPGPLLGPGVVIIIMGYI